MSEKTKAAQRLSEKSKVQRLKQDFLGTIATEQTNYPIQAMQLEEIDRANKAAYHGNIDGDFNWW